MSSTETRKDQESAEEDTLTHSAVGKQEPVTRDSTVLTMAENTGNSVKAGGDTSQGQGTETLEDLLGTLQKQMKSSDWLKQNTAEKWASENPDLAKEYMEAIKKS